MLKVNEGDKIVFYKKQPDIVSTNHYTLRKEYCVTKKTTDGYIIIINDQGFWQKFHVESQTAKSFLPLNELRRLKLKKIMKESNHVF